MTVCSPDNFCQSKNIKNPATYAIKRSGVLKDMKKEGKEHICTLCGKKFSTLGGLGNHKARIHQPLRHGSKQKSEDNEEKSTNNKEKPENNN